MRRSSRGRSHESPVIASVPWLFGLSFVAAADGVKATYDGRTAYATPSDLLKLRAYDAVVETPGLEFLRFGVHPELVQTHLAEELGVSREELVEHGSFRRVAMWRRTPPEPEPEVDVESLRTAASAAGSTCAGRAEDVSYHTRSRAPGRSPIPTGRESCATLYLATSPYTGDSPCSGGNARANAWGVTRWSIAVRTVQCRVHRAYLGSSALGHSPWSRSWKELAPDCPAVRELIDFWSVSSALRLVQALLRLRGTPRDRGICL